MYWLITAYVAAFMGFTIISEISEGNEPFPSTVLTSSITEASSTLLVNSTATFPTSGRIYTLDGEIICFSSKTATSFVVATDGRGCFDVGTTKRTEAKSLGSGSPIFNADSAVIAYGLNYNLVRDAQDVGNNLSVFGGIKFGLNFLLKGLPKFISFDYSYLEGDLWGFPLGLLKMTLIAVFGVPLVAYMVTVIFGRN